MKDVTTWEQNARRLFNDGIKPHLRCNKCGNKDITVKGPPNISEPDKYPDGFPLILECKCGAERVLKVKLSVGLEKGS